MTHTAHRHCAIWLFDKMARYVRGNRFADTAQELGELMTEASGYGWEFAQLLDRTKWLADLVLASTDAGAAFADERSELLPDDEALLAAQWALIEPSVFEVRAIAADAFELRNLRTGDDLVVSNLNPAVGAQPGGVVYGRALPVGDTWRAMSAWVDVPAHQVEAMIRAIDAAVDGDPRALATAIGATFAAPRSPATNRSGSTSRFPALGGRTPRESAADPVARAALIRLLATFPETDEPTQMSPARLRRSLGI